MLAMGVNDDAGRLTPRGVLESIASVLAPTGDLWPTANFCMTDI